MNRSRMIGPAITATLALLLVSCGPKDVIRWSPDGERAIVHGADGDYLIDASGKILGKSPDAVAWMPDSKRVVGVRKTKAKNWDEFAGLLGQQRAEDDISAANQYLKMIQAYRGDWEKFSDEPEVKAWQHAHPKTLFEAAFYLMQTQRAALEPLLKTSREKGNNDPADLLGAIWEVFIGPASPADGGKELILLRSTDTIPWAAPSPDGKVLAFTRGDFVDLAGETADGFDLEVISTEGGKPTIVNAGPSSAAWTADGRALVYARPINNAKSNASDPDVAENSAQLGSITRRRIRDDGGALLAKLDEPEDLVGIVFVAGGNRVACLPDGRILFSALPLQLPVLDSDRPKTASLYILQLDHGPALKRVVAEKALKQLPNRVDRFVSSPDGARVAIPGDSGAIAIVALESGQVTQVQAPISIYQYSQNQQTKDEKTLPAEPPQPAWRNATELCYATGPGSKGGSPNRGEIVLRKLGGEPHAISKSWSDEMTNQFLPRPKTKADAAPAAASPAAK